MKILNVLSLLMDYPTEALVNAQEELIAAVGESTLPTANKQSLIDFIKTRCALKLLDWQSEYDSSFERGRSLSLLLFEHVHGESRDRGQAMVNLQQQYQAAGLDINVRELPDYIPLYLEFLTTQGEANARAGLLEVAHILAVLACRLDERANNYGAIFHALVYFAEVQLDLADIQAQIKNETRDDTPEALDKVWEDEAVTFGGDTRSSACGSSQIHPSPLQSKMHQEFLNIDGLVNLHTAKRA